MEPMRLPGTNRREPEDKKTGIKWIPGYELAKNKHYVGPGWRRSPELVEEAKKRIDPKMWGSSVAVGLLKTDGGRFEDESGTPEIRLNRR